MPCCPIRWRYSGRTKYPTISTRATALVRAALEAHYVGWFHLPLDVEKMRAAAALFVGEHDFSAFRSSECQAKSPVRTIDRFEITRQGETIHFVVRANAFLHHMVRNLIGTLVYDGKGKHQRE